MDSFKELEKTINDLKNIKESLDSRIKNLHAQEIAYLEEIPRLKIAVDNEKLRTGKVFENSLNASKELEIIKDRIKELKSVLNKLNNETALLQLEYTDVSRKIVETNIQIENKRRDIKNREIYVQEKERKCDAIEIVLNKKESDLDQREFEINKKDRLILEKSSVLDKNISTHEVVLELHRNDLETLRSRKLNQSQVEDSLNIKNEKLEKLIKDNSDIKAALLLQADKLSKEIKACEQKQGSLDRNILDLTNQENLLKIKELKIIKMAREAGIEKELKSLEESIK